MYIHINSTSLQNEPRGGKQSSYAKKSTVRIGKQWKQKSRVKASLGDVLDQQKSDLKCHNLIQMKGKCQILFQNSHFHDKSSQSSQASPSTNYLGRPMQKETLDFFRNLKINRFIIPTETPPQETLRIYFDEYKKLYDQNKKLNRQFIQIVEEKNELAQVFISKMKLKETRGGKVKRKRRYASQIKREFHCPMKECQKCYGTEGSMTQHVKIKHIEYFKSGEYDIYISELLRRNQTLEVDRT